MRGRGPIAIGLCVLAAFGACATTFTWTGEAGAEAGWSEGGNWDRGGAVPGAGDVAVVPGRPAAVRAADQPVLNGLAEIRIFGLDTKTNSVGLYAVAGESVDIVCPIVFTDKTPYLGKAKAGRLVVKSRIDSTTGGSLNLCGDVELAEGATVKNPSGKCLELQTGASVRLSTPLVAEQKSYPILRTRGTSALTIGCEKALSQFGADLVLGTKSSYGGFLDLDGHDLTIAKLSVTPTEKWGSYVQQAGLASATPATLTVTEGMMPLGGSYADTAALWEPLLGAVSLKLDSAVGGTLTVSNFTGRPSETSGALVSSAGTLRLADGTCFTRLGRLVKEGTGAIEVGNVTLGGTELSLAGSGRLTLNADLAVRRAKVWETGKKAFAYLEPGTHSAAEIPEHLAGAGRLSVRCGCPAEELSMKTNRRWLVAADVAFDRDASRPLAFRPPAPPPDKSIREIALGLASSAPAEEPDLRAAQADGAKFGAAVVCVGESRRYVTLADGAWRTNLTATAALDGRETVVCRLDDFERAVSYAVRAADGSETALASADADDLSFSELRIFGEGLVGSLRGVLVGEGLPNGFGVMIR